jgi:competence protein ComEA
VLWRPSIKAGRLLNRWSLVAAVLVIIIITGGVVIGLHYPRSQPIQITISTAPVLEGEIYIGGAVNNPGIYPFYAGDSLEDVLQAAGGVTDDADLSHIELKVMAEGTMAELQKVNINTADAWLLAALPGIGDVRAQAIMDYRQQSGPFRDINELLNVEGIGTVTLDNICDLITVGD